MRPQAELRRDLLLVGGGHSHALALRTLGMRPVQGLRVTLVSPASHSPYSGMLPGLVAGHYSFEDSHIDLARLCQWAGARFVTAEAVGLDPAARRVELAGRPALDYDVVSLDIGSQPELDSVPGARAHATPVKPVAGLSRRWDALYARLRGRDGTGDAQGVRIGLVGGGAGSVELALAMAHRLGGRPVRLDLWCGTPEILPGYNPRARRAVMRALAACGVGVHLDARVAAVGENHLTLADGAQHPFDELFWCTAAAAAPWIAASGLATDGRGFLAVSDTLQSVDDPRVFGAGDIAVQLAHPRPRAGVFAVRQAPVLAHNLCALLLERPLRRHRPQRRFLSLLSLGERRATADRGPFSATGRWVWRWKDRIDRAFMRRFADLPPMAPRRPRRLPELPENPQMVCGGCGAKVGADPLATVLADLSRAYPQHCSGGGDDAAALPLPAGATVLQSLDILREIVPDPWVMGRIAAIHALSDLHACGARPVAALAAAILPFAAPALLGRDLQQLLAGALHEFARENCRLVGGHSMQGGELGLGFAVSGVPADGGGRLLGKTGALPGDALVLTAPLGTGTLFAAHMRLLADGRDIAGAVSAMLAGNGAAARLALARGAHACTDVTGFGLLGHLLEMLGDALAARLVLDHIPLLAGAEAQLRAGVFSSMHRANVDSGAARLHGGAGTDAARAQIVFDPQTCGGLLVALPPGNAGEFCAALAAAGYGRAAVIGEVLDAAGAGFSGVALT